MPYYRPVEAAQTAATILAMPTEKITASLSALNGAPLIKAAKGRDQLHFGLTAAHQAGSVNLDQFVQMDEAGTASAVTPREAMRIVTQCLFNADALQTMRGPGVDKETIAAFTKLVEESKNSQSWAVKHAAELTSLSS